MAKKVKAMCLQSGYAANRIAGLLWFEAYGCCQSHVDVAAGGGTSYARATVAYFILSHYSCFSLHSLQLQRKEAKVYLWQVSDGARARRKYCRN